MSIDWTRSILVSDENTAQVICGKEILYVRGLAAGRSIVSVEKTSDDGSTAIFTITYTDGTTSTFSIQEADFDYSVIAPEFDPSVSYVVGDLVTYNEKLYQFINDHSGAWDIHDVEQVTLVDIMTDQLGGIIAPDFDENSAYSVGEYVIYESKLYRFTSAHTAGDPWDSSEVESKVVTDDFVDDNKLHYYSLSRTDFAPRFGIRHYDIGEYVSYNNGIYRFISEHSAGDPWNVSEVEAVVISADFVDDKKLYEYAVSYADIANQFGNYNYNVGDYVYYNDGTGTAVYRFTSAHTAGDPWNSSEVEEVKITRDFIDWNRLYTILSDNIANEFSPSTQYMAGEYVMHLGLLYQFDTDHTGVWSLDDVTHVKLFPLIPTIESSVNRRLIKWNVANDFDQYTNYSVGDYVLYEDYLYRFTSNHTAGAWNASHATRVSVTSELKTKLSDAPSDDKTYGRKNGTWSEAVTENDVFYMREYYVNGSTGSDDNTGTSAQPFKTISKAIQSIPYTMQGKIHIAAGYYNENFKYEDKDINFYLSGNVNFVDDLSSIIRRSKTRFFNETQNSVQISFKNNLEIYDSDVTFFNVDLNFTGLYNWESTYYALIAGRSHVIVNGTIMSAQMYSKSGGYSVVHARYSYIQLDSILGSNVKATNLLEAGENGVIAYKSNTYPASADVENYEHTVYNGRIVQGAEVDPYSKAEIDALLATKQDLLTFDDTGAVVSFSDGIEAPVVDLVASIKPVQSGSGDPSPSNIRPISGWTGAIIQRTGKNLVHCTGLKGNRGITPVENADGSITVSGTPTTNYADIMSNKTQVLKAGTYTFSIDKPLNCAVIIRASYSNTSGDYLSISIYAGQTKVTVTAVRDIQFWRLYVAGMTSGTSINETFFPQLEIGSEATSFEPCISAEYPVSFGDAGTVYGGSLDVTMGLLTVTKANITSYAGETLPSAWISDRDVYAPGTTPTTGAQVVYELADPVTYQLTPTEVITLLGQNNIWADTGDITITYYLDSSIAKAIENTAKNAKYDDGKTRDMITQSSEATTTASKNYAVGDLLIVNNQLLRATAVITSGTTIVIGTSGNAEVIDLAAIISELSARISALE